MCFSKRVCGDGVGRSEILKDGRLFDFGGEGYIQTNSGNELIADSMADIEVFSKAEFQKIIDETKSSLISLVIDYEATDCLCILMYCLIQMRKGHHLDMRYFGWLNVIWL